MEEEMLQVENLLTEIRCDGTSARNGGRWEICGSHDVVESVRRSETDLVKGILNVVDFIATHEGTANVRRDQ